MDESKTPITLEELQLHNGVAKKTIFVGLYGYVFDVTDSPHYQEGGSYSVFAGHDISIACANYSQDSKYLDQLFDK